MTQPYVAYGDLTQLAQNLTAASGGDFEQTAAEVVRQAAASVAEDAAARAPRKTGALSRSITVTFMGPLTAIVGPGAKYGVFQEFGTGSKSEFGGSYYWIYPKYAKKLRFQVNGKWVFAKKVHHPGVAPHPFMRPAIASQLQAMSAGMANTSLQMITGQQSGN